MTKRQRAKYYQDDDEQKLFLTLLSESNKKKNLSKEEQALKRSEVARRRKHQSAQRAEKDKADTINRLLKKQASKSKRVIKDDVDPSPSATHLPPADSVRYTTTTSGSHLSLPDSLLDELLVSSKHRPVPRKVACEISGCKNEKKYVAKASGKAVCSLEHYRLAERT
ncbi:PAPA-1-like conserved region-domain-containing protein [Fennellomyces sp. T-0311]|nr:PAPA-1-like conserved region-domain-containing protein [Fennellomyces sp. T-0311]